MKLNDMPIGEAKIFQNAYIVICIRHIFHDMLKTVHAQMVSLGHLACEQGLETSTAHRESYGAGCAGKYHYGAGLQPSHEGTMGFGDNSLLGRRQGLSKAQGLRRSLDREEKVRDPFS